MNRANQACIMLDVPSWAPTLRAVGDGVWASGTCHPVSYPEQGHVGCLELERESFWFEHRNAVILEAVRRWPPPGALLDVGGGNGCVTRALLDAGHAAVLLEPGADGVRHARARGVAPIIHSTLEAAGIVRAVLPAVGLFDVIEHVADDAAFLRRIRGLMVPRGRLYVTVPALDWIWSTADVSAGHHRRYSRTGLTLKLEAAGFEVEYASHFFAILPVPIFIGRSLRGRILGPGDAQTRARIEHRPRSALLRRALAGMTRLECHWVRRGTRLPTGSSCLAVARA